MMRKGHPGAKTSSEVRAQRQEAWQEVWPSGICGATATSSRRLIMTDEVCLHGYAA